MSGFPARPTRTTYGPPLLNTAPVRDPRKQVGAETFTLLLWQVAGMGLLAPRAMVGFTVSGDPATVDFHAEAWSPDGGGTAPTIARQGTGDYILTYPQTVTDELGDTQGVQFSHALAFVSTAGATPARIAAAAVHGTDAYKLLATVYNASGTAVDNDRLIVLAW